MQLPLVESVCKASVVVAVVLVAVTDPVTVKVVEAKLVPTERVLEALKTPLTCKLPVAVIFATLIKLPEKKALPWTLNNWEGEVEPTPTFPLY